MSGRTGPVLRLLLGWALLVLVATLVWWLVAPQPQVAQTSGLRVAPDVPELDAAQDGWFVVVTAVAGLGTAVASLRRSLDGPRTLALLAASAAGSVAVWLLGRALGSLASGPRATPLPPGTTDRLAAGVVVAPAGLELQALVALATWPLVTSVLVAVVLVVRSLGERETPPGQDPGQDHGQDAAQDLERDPGQEADGTAASTWTPRGEGS